jgi:hypothetical protein
VFTEYRDIRERIPEPPTWFDECAVPRYCDFTPHYAANIYAREAVLFLIECQACGHQFRVCLTSCPDKPMLRRCTGEIHGNARNQGRSFGAPAIRATNVAKTAVLVLAAAWLIVR